MNYKQTIIHFFILALFSCNEPEYKPGAGVVLENAVEYNDYIIKRQAKIINHILAVAAVLDTNLDSAEAMLGKGVLVTDSALADIENLNDFNGDSLFKNRAISNFKFYRKLFTSDYPKIISINRKGEAATDTDHQMLQSIQAALEDEEAELDKRLSNAQADFAKKNKMPLLENEVQQKVDSAN
jgi:hypothetical protein